MIRRCRGYLYDRAAERLHQIVVFSFRIDDYNVRLSKQSQYRYLELGEKRLAPTGYSQNKSVTVE